jgi:hypothetical protein
LSNPVEDREPESLGASQGNMPVDPIQGEINKLAEFQCKVCGLVFTNQADLIEHMTTHERQEEQPTQAWRKEIIR